MTILKTGEDVKNLVLHIGENVTWYRHWKIAWHILKKITTKHIIDPAIALLDIYS